jgi:hypothetical protein
MTGSGWLASELPELSSLPVPILARGPCHATCHERGAAPADSIKKGLVKAEELLRDAMSLPVATTISGIDSLEVLRQNMKIARGFRPLTEKQMEALRRRCAPYAADGHLEMYKSTMKYDAEVGRRQHGFPSPEEMPM